VSEGYLCHSFIYKKQYRMLTYYLKVCHINIARGNNMSYKKTTTENGLYKMLAQFRPRRFFEGGENERVFSAFE